MGSSGLKEIQRAELETGKAVFPYGDRGIGKSVRGDGSKKVLGVIGEHTLFGGSGASGE